jgi:septal ring factor EnvC (AmiA/AmiB activator)
LPWPAEGRVNYGFGQQKHPQLGTTFDSHGIEIAADSAQPVKAVADGRVIYANWFKGYGNLLIIDHGNSYYTLYAQNARLVKGVGDVVARGETVGFSGLPGSNGIYFEIRKGGTPQDPRPWLRKR